MKTKTYFQFTLLFVLTTFSLLGSLQVDAKKLEKDLATKGKTIIKTKCLSPAPEAATSLQALDPLPGKCGKVPPCSSEVFLTYQPQGVKEAVEKLLATLQKRPTTYSVRDLPATPLKADDLILTLKKKFEEAKKENLQNVLCWEVLNDQCKNTGVVLSLDPKPECPYYVFPTGFIRMVEFVKKDLTREIRYDVESHCTPRLYIK